MSLLKSLRPAGRRLCTVFSGFYRGLKLHLDLQCEAQVWAGLNERETFAALRRLSRGCPGIIDLGAAKGELAIRFLLTPGVTRVVAAEPSPTELSLLDANLAANGLRGDSRLHLHAGFAGEGPAPAWRTLDELAVGMPEPLFLKMDIDGAEAAVLASGRRTLATMDCRLLVETHSPEAEAGCLALLRELGYDTAIIQSAWWRALLPEHRSDIAHNRWLIGWCRNAPGLGTESPHPRPGTGGALAFVRGTFPPIMRWELWLGHCLLYVRPAVLASGLKRLLGVRRLEVVAPDGTFWIDPASFIGQEIATKGEFDPDTLAALRRVLRPGDTFIDIGANEGYFSVIAAPLVGPGGRVIAIEPQSRLRAVLRRNFDLNGCRQVEHVVTAVSDQPGYAELHLAPDMNNGSSGLAAATSYQVATETVPTVTLAQLLDRITPATPPVVKMDIESWEYEAIFGSPDVFRSGRIRALILELHPGTLQKRGLDPKLLTAFLRDCGYTLEPGSAGLLWTHP